MNTLVISISGPSGSGKTTLANGLLAKWPSDVITVLRSDAYYHDQSQCSLQERALMNYDAPEAIDFPLLVQHLKQLQAGQAIHIPEYDFKTHARTAKHITVQPCPIIIVEGILLLAIEEIRALAQHRIYLDTPLDVCLLRRIRRDCMERGRTVESVLNQYEKTVHPMLMKYVLPSKQFASQLFDDGGPVPGPMSWLNQTIDVFLNTQMQPAAAIMPNDA